MENEYTPNHNAPTGLTPTGPTSTGPTPTGPTITGPTSTESTPPGPTTTTSSSTPPPSSPPLIPEALPEKTLELHPHALKFSNPPKPKSSTVAVSRRMLVAMASLVLIALIGSGVAITAAFVNGNSSNTEAVGEISTATISLANTAAGAQSEVLSDADPLAGQTANQIDPTPRPATDRSDSGAAETTVSVSDTVDKLLPSAVTIYVTVNNGILSTASGVIVDDTGLVITAAHVITAENAISRGANVLLELSSGQFVEAEVVGYDTAVDIAVLEFDPQGLEFESADIADVSALKVGDLAIAVGTPFGLENSITVGYISHLHRSSRTLQDDFSVYPPSIQTDAPINSGNSGGMLANSKGEVIGINVFIQTVTFGFSGASGGNVGLGFAVPIDLAIRVANLILEGEEFTYGYLGIVGESELGEGPGPVVQSVESNTPASRAGIRDGDRIVSFDGERVDDINELVSFIQFHPPNTIAKVGIMRNGNQLELDVRIGESVLESATVILE